MCLNYLKELGGLRPPTFIFYDRQVTLKAFDNQRIGSRLIAECRESLNNLVELTNLTIIRVPGNITGNERDNGIVREDATLTSLSLKMRRKFRSWMHEKLRKQIMSIIEQIFVD